MGKQRERKEDVGEAESLFFAGRYCRQLSQTAFTMFFSPLFALKHPQAASSIRLVDAPFVTTEAATSSRSYSTLFSSYFLADAPSMLPLPLVLVSSLGVDASSSALEAAAKKVDVGSADMKSNCGKSTGSSISSTMMPSLS